MTGFGRGTAEHGDRRATVDIRAVNHRYLDLKLRGAALAPAVEDAIGTRVRAALSRGSVSVGVHLTRAGAAPTALRIDESAARDAHAALSALAATLGMAGPDLRLVLAQPGVINAPIVDASDTAADDTADATAVLAALDAALAQLGTMRTAEGHALAHELTAQLDELTAARAKLAGLAAAAPGQLQRRLEDRIRRLLADSANAAIAELDPARLAHEVALLADRADVTEELVRLASHLDQARALVAAADPVGRRLDFLTQELGRELNTIGSKSAIAEISAVIVDAKAVLEKLREQVQNVE